MDCLRGWQDSPLKGGCSEWQCAKDFFFCNRSYTGSAGSGNRVHEAGAGEGEAGFKPDKGFASSRRKDRFKAFPVEKEGEMEQFKKECGDCFPKGSGTSQKEGISARRKGWGR